jgi:hypothetical protein
LGNHKSPEKPPDGVTDLDVAQTLHDWCALDIRSLVGGTESAVKVTQSVLLPLGWARLPSFETTVAVSSIVLCLALRI